MNMENPKTLFDARTTVHVARFDALFSVQVMRPGVLRTAKRDQQEIAVRLRKGACHAPAAFAKESNHGTSPSRSW
jgi:hypothetical protein